MTREIRDFVGTMFQTTFQRNSLSQKLSLSFQRPFQVEAKTGEGWIGRTGPHIARQVEYDAM